MKKWLGLGLTALMLSGCGELVALGGGGPQIVGSGKATTVTKQVGSFKAVELDGSMDAVITIGKASGITIQGDDNIVSHVKLEIKGDSLRIGMEKGSYSMKKPLKVTFSVPELNAASLNGSGDLSIHGLHGSALSLAVNGSGNVKADGTAGSLSASISGSGDLSLFGLKSGDTSVQISGSGDAEVNVSGSLDASIAGSGGVHYKGHPSHVQKSVSGSGEVGPAE